MAVYIGTSGFAYPEWRPTFYPEGLSQPKLLQHYATRLTSVEINYTFNRFPTEKLLSGWAAKVPEQFTFSLKLPRRITHEKRLRECAEEMKRFTEAALTLGPRLGAVLAQTPPTLALDQEALDGFIAEVPDGIRLAMEFRHASWDSEEVRARLAGAGIAWVIAEDETREATVQLTAPGFAYARLRSPGYSPDALSEWRSRFAPVISSGRDLYCYLRHDQDGSNALAAETLAGMFSDTVEA